MKVFKYLHKKTYHLFEVHFKEMKNRGIKALPREMNARRWSSYGILTRFIDIVRQNHDSICIAITTRILIDYL